MSLIGYLFMTIITVYVVAEVCCGLSEINSIKELFILSYPEEEDSEDEC